MDVIVIGGGMGGLSAAIGLAARGARVTLLEKNARLGGKLNIWESGGFTFDTGPHVLTMPWALEEVFAQGGRRLDGRGSGSASPTRACAKSLNCTRSTAAPTRRAARESSPLSPTCSGGRGRSMCAAACTG